ncbi:MAG: alpha/beta hydrolase [Propionicimonas sp.]|uniref:alpha/beta hydrolase n=1 Tax=Propionicimonas sp. TaxID=1955623 RepID=UPI003D143E4A
MRPSLRVCVPLLAVVVALAGCDAAPQAASAEQVRISAVAGVAIDRPPTEEVDVQANGLVAGLGGGDLTAYLAQHVRWSACGKLECASVLAPLDYADPSARALTLAMARKPATKSPRLGTLFINPGGPGASGKGFVSSFDTTGLEQYDIVGWDPRGTGESTPVRCYGGAETDAFLNLDSSPDTEEERTKLIEATYAFGQSCEEHSGVLLTHISTIETARDLDLLRQLLGDATLTYLGYSYGTQIGATYAELFPQNTGRLVLDAAVDITDDDAVIQAMGFDLALGNFASWCAGQACGLGGTKQEVLDAITGLFDALDAAPLAVKNRVLTQSLAVTGVAAMLYGGTAAWPTLATIVVAARNGNGRGLLLAADSQNARNNNGTFGTLFYAFPAISCLDSDDDKGVLDADRQWQEDQQKAPIFGKYFGPAYGCALWPVRPSRQLDIRGVGARPIVVIGGTGDNATPYQQAVAMAKQLDSGVLVTHQGEGHGSFGGKSACIDTLVVNYLVDDVVPEDGVRCS